MGCGVPWVSYGVVGDIVNILFTVHPCSPMFTQQNLLPGLLGDRKPWTEKMVCPRVAQESTVTGGFTVSRFES